MGDDERHALIVEWVAVARLTCGIFDGQRRAGQMSHSIPASFLSDSRWLSFNVNGSRATTIMRAAPAMSLIEQLQPADA
jgi:hypothetical protein